MGLPDSGPQQVIHQAGPVDARFNDDQTAFPVHLHDAVEARHIEEDRAGAKLLAAHCMARSGDADSQTRRRGAANDMLKDWHRLHDDRSTDDRGIQL
jgi:hypothetical protein